MMKYRFLEITFRRGRPFAAYLYLPRKPGDKSIRSDQQSAGLLIDYAEDGRPIGIEITAPSKVTLTSLNEALATANQDPVTADDLAPLLSTQPPTSAVTN